MEKSKIREIEEELLQVERMYSIDREELARLLFVASGVMLVVSVYSFYTLNSALSGMKEVESSMESTVGITQSESFNRSVQALRDLGGTGPGQAINTALEGLESARTDLRRVQESVERMEKTRNRLQWMALISIMGIVAGGSILFI